MRIMRSLLLTNPHQEQYDRWLLCPRSPEDSSLGQRAFTVTRSLIETVGRLGSIRTLSLVKLDITERHEPGFFMT